MLIKAQVIIVSYFYHQQANVGAQWREGQLHKVHNHRRRWSSGKLGYQGNSNKYSLGSNVKYYTSVTAEVEFIFCSGYLQQITIILAFQLRCGDGIRILT